MSVSTEPPRPKVLLAWPESADELLRALQSFARIQAKHPTVPLELVLFGRILPQTAIDVVLNADDRQTAAHQLFAAYLDALP